MLVNVSQFLLFKVSVSRGYASSKEEGERVIKRSFIISDLLNLTTFQWLLALLQKICIPSESACKVWWSLFFFRFLSFYVFKNEISEESIKKIVFLVLACDCDTTYSTGLCAEGTGQCECKGKYTGKKCDQCNKGYYQFPECKSM